MPISVDDVSAVLLGFTYRIVVVSVTIWTVVFIIWTIQINVEYAFGIQRG